MNPLYKTLKKTVYHYLRPGKEASHKEKIISYFLIILVLANVVAVILESVGSIYNSYQSFFDLFDRFSLIVFSVEYLLRIWSITENERFSKPVTGRIKYFFTPLALIDLLAVLPFYIYFILPYDLRFLRIFRLLRLFVLLKLERYSDSLNTIGRVLRNKRADLLVAFSIILFLIVVAGCLVYMAESDVQPDKFNSIPASIYWSVITITTIGYGDVYPVTILGKIFTVFIALIGLGLIALPVGILTSGFNEELEKKRSVQCCPHCGEELTHTKKE
jgi:voltage-gated potassium channel